MPDWSSLAELQRDAGVFVKFMHACLGVYAWEWFISLDFDWDVITGKKKFRWPMIFYFANRYLLLFAMAGIAVALDSTTEINCQALYTFNQLAGDAAVGLASINLSLRTIAVYGNSKWITALLVLVILGHWSLILQGTVLTAVWSPEAQTCAIIKTNNKILAAIFIYSMCFDLLVFLLNFYKFAIQGRNRDIGTSRLGKMIFSDGLAYFFIAFVANLVATIFMVLNLNSVMTIIFNVPAAIASTIVAGRVVRRLSNFTNQGPEMYSVTHSSGAPYRPGVTSRTAAAGAGGVGIHSIGGGGLAGGVHVQMETFSRQEGPDAADLEYGYSKELETKPVVL
ncbi:hypothetical protein C8J56DRAFT_328364 [Mycena floridula]|nr:hypothetical protein C8J56DRAFT_328364 [Mycena floridula]